MTHFLQLGSTFYLCLFPIRPRFHKSIEEAFHHPTRAHELTVTACTQGSPVLCILNLRLSTLQGSGMLVTMARCGWKGGDFHQRVRSFSFTEGMSSRTPKGSTGPIVNVFTLKICRQRSKYLHQIHTHTHECD